MQTRTESSDFQTGNVVLIAFSHLIHDTYTAFLAPLLPLLVEKLGFSYTLAGFLPSLLSFPSLINPVIGALADRIRWSYFVIGAMATTGICMSLLGNAPSYGVLVILLLITGISTACYHVPAPVMIRQFSGNQVGKGMSFLMIGGELARMVGPLAIVGALSWWGLEGTYRLMLMAVLAAVFLFMKLRYVDPQQGSAKGTAEEPDWLQTLRTFMSFFLNIGGLTLFLAGMRRAIIIFLPSYLITRGYSVAAAGVALAVAQGGGALGALLSGIFSDKFGRKLVLLIVALVTPVLMGIFLFDPGTLTLPVLALLGTFLFSTSPVLLTIVQEANSTHPAYMNGIYMMLNFVIGALMSVLLGALSDHFGFDWTFRFALVWFLGTIPCVLLLPGRLRPPQ